MASAVNADSAGKSTTATKADWALVSRNVEPNVAAPTPMQLYVAKADNSKYATSASSANYSSSSGYASSAAGATGLSSSGYGNTNLTYYQTGGSFAGAST